MEYIPLGEHLEVLLSIYQIRHKTRRFLVLSNNGTLHNCLRYNKYWASEVTHVQTKIVLEGMCENQLKCWNSRIHDYYVK